MAQWTDGSNVEWKPPEVQRAQETSVMRIAPVAGRALSDGDYGAAVREGKDRYEDNRRGCGCGCHVDRRGALPFRGESSTAQATNPLKFCKPHGARRPFRGRERRVHQLRCGRRHTTSGAR